MKTNGKYRLVCTMTGSWHVEQMMCHNDGTGVPRLFWTTIKRFEQRHKEGYEAATKWIEKNL